MIKYITFFTTLVFASFASHATTSQCTDILEGLFTDGVASHDSSGKVQFEKNSSIYLYTNNNYYYNDGVIDFNNIEDKTSGSYKSCGNRKCTSSGQVTPELDLGAFQSSSSNNNVEVTTSKNLTAGDYKDIVVKSHAELKFTTSGGVYRIKKLELEKNSEVYFSGGVYYIDQFKVKESGHVHHNGGGTVIIYAEDNVEFEKNSRFNRQGSASNFLLYSEKDVKFKKNTQSRVYVYSEKKVEMEKNSFLKGAINAKDITLKESVIYFDKDGIQHVQGCDSLANPPAADPVLVGHWKNNVCALTGANGEVVDAIAGNNGRSVDGASIDVNGKFCQALRFDGNDANVLIPHDNDFALADGSVSFWFKASDLGHSSDRGHGGQGLWSKDSGGWDAGGDHLTIWLNSNGSIRARHQIPNDSSKDINLYASSGAVTANQWYHLVYTWGSGGSFMFLNGNQVDTNTAVRSLAGNPEPIIVGANAWVTENYGSSSNNLKDKFKGEIDDIRLYSGQLDIDEVRTIRDEENPDTCDVCVVAEPELVAHYGADVCSIDGDGGTYVDIINGYNGMYIDGASISQGKFCNAVSFDGSNDHINIPHVSDFSIAEGAISLWINVPDIDYANIDDSIHDGQAIFSKDSRGTDNGGKHLTMWVNDNGSIRVRHQTSGNNEIESSGGLINEGQWHHVMYTWGNNGKRLYIDGTLRDSDGGTSQGIETNPEPIVLGANASTTGNNVSEPSKLDNWFKGSIDDVRVYGNAQPDDNFVTALSNENYQCTECSQELVHYKFEGLPADALNSENGNFNGSEYNVSGNGLSFLHGGGDSTLGSCQVLSVPKNDSGSVQEAMNTGIDVDTDIGIKGTISFWYQANESWVNGRARQLFDASDRTKYFHGTIISDGRIMFGLEDDRDGDARIFTTSSFNYSPGTWVHLAFAWDITNSTIMKIFVNGVEQTVTMPINSVRTGKFKFDSELFFGDNSHPSYLVGGSTGNSADGQFDDIRIYQNVQGSSAIMQDMADLSPCAARPVNHYLLEFNDYASTCSAAPQVTVKACNDAQCSSLVSGTQSVSVEYVSGGNVTSVVNNLRLNNGLGAADNWTIPASAEVGTFRVSAASPQATSQTNAYSCNQQNCEINFVDLQILYNNNGSISEDIPAQIAEKPFLNNNNSVSASVLVCQDSAQSTNLEFAVECVNPAVCSGRSFDVTVGGTTQSITPVNGGTTPGNGNYVSFTVPAGARDMQIDQLNFNDVGEIKLIVRNAGQTTSEQFVVKPGHLTLAINDSQNVTTTTAGDFDLTVSAFGFNGTAMPNYQPGDLRFAMLRHTPETVIAANASLTVTNPNGNNNTITLNDNTQEALADQFDNQSFDSNSAQPTFQLGKVNLASTITEVGEFGFDVLDFDYLGAGSVQSKLAQDGNTDPENFVLTRFIPAYFSLNTTFDYSPYCGSFSYRGDTLRSYKEFVDETPHILEFTARSANNGITTYYDANEDTNFRFSKDETLFAGRTYTTSDDSISTTVGITEFDVGTVNDGKFEFHFKNDTLTFLKGASPVLPVQTGNASGQVNVGFQLDANDMLDLDGIGVKNTASDNSWSDASIEAVISGTEIREGRLRLVNAVTAERNVDVVIEAEYFAVTDSSPTGAWEPNDADSCTTFSSDQIVLLEWTSTVTSDPTYSGSGKLDEGIGDGASAMNLQISFVNADSTSGSVFLGYDIPTELSFFEFPWCSNTNHEGSKGTLTCVNPVAEFTFGQDRGNDRVIHWREVLK